MSPAIWTSLASGAVCQVSDVGTVVYEALVLHQPGGPATARVGGRDRPVAIGHRDAPGSET